MYGRTDDQKALAAAVHEFCLAALAPTAREDDETETFRKDLVHRLGEQGFCGIATPEAHGGLGLGYTEYAIALEEIASVSASYATAVAVTGLPQIILVKFGNDDQRARWLPGLARGELLGAFALSEPGSGSDAASLRTTAVQRGDRYLLNGTTYWITHGGYADLYVVMKQD